MMNVRYGKNAIAMVSLVIGLVLLGLPLLIEHEKEIGLSGESLEEKVQATLEQLTFDAEELSEMGECLREHPDGVPPLLCNQLPEKFAGELLVLRSGEIVYWLGQSQRGLLTDSAAASEAWTWSGGKGSQRVVRSWKVGEYLIQRAIDAQLLAQKSGIEGAFIADKTGDDVVYSLEKETFEGGYYRPLLAGAVQGLGFLLFTLGLYLLLRQRIRSRWIISTTLTIWLIMGKWILGGNVSFIPSQLGHFFDSTFNTSPPSFWLDWIINLLILFVIIMEWGWLLRWLHRKARNYPRLLVLLDSILLLTMFLLGTLAIRKTLLSPASPFELDRLLQWDSKNILVLALIVIIVTMVFLIGYSIQRQIGHLNVRIEWKLLLLSLAALLLLPLYFQIETGIHPFAFFIFSFIIAILLDLFNENVSGGLTWPFIWLSVLAGCSSLLVFSLSQERQKYQAIQYLEDISAHPGPENIEDREFSPAIYQEGDLVSGERSLYPTRYPFDQVPKEGEILNLRQNQQRHLIQSGKGDRIAVISYPIDPISKPIAVYSYLFVIWVLFALILMVMNSQFSFLPKEWKYHWNALPSLRKRIQYYILAVTVGSFVIISVFTYFYFTEGERDFQLKWAVEQGEQLLKDVQYQMERDSQPRLGEIFQNRRTLHGLEGAQLFHSAGENILLESPNRMPYKAYYNLLQGDQPFISSGNEVFGLLEIQDRKWFISVPLSLAPTLGGGSRNMLVPLLNVYVFLFVIASGIAVAISNSITAPLKVLRERLKNVKIGNKNNTLEWEQKDEIGELIKDYNKMIYKIEESARILAATERETAWREMAKQVAHEIKNPLTPMKLSIQHLQFAMQDDEEKNRKMIEKVSTTLIEQIDNLNRIASEFTNFAKMPEPENQNVILNEVVASVHDLFRKREDMDINLKVPIDEIIVFADRNHLVRVMNNLLKNAIQSIPRERRGKIDIQLYKTDEDAIIKVSDNGKGIPEELRDKVFKPNFTSKSSGTGLGLAICANIIEGFNGKIYFETEVNKGTDFYVIIPLMRMEDNLDTDKRVVL